MLRLKKNRNNERGATLVEFSIGVTVFAVAMFAVLEFSRLLWVHNALTDAARRGARYAVMHSENDSDAVKNIVVYGNAAGTGNPMLANLSTEDVDVDYNDFGMNDGTVTVSIDDYEFQFVLPLLPTSVTMPDYSTTLTGESAGFIPANVAG
jgi:Flp pilus assembly protein TadG